MANDQKQLIVGNNEKSELRRQFSRIFELIFLGQKVLSEKRKNMFSNLCFDIQTAFNLLSQGSTRGIVALDIMQFVDFKFNELEINDFLIYRFAKTKSNALSYTEFSDFIFLGNYLSDHVSPQNTRDRQKFENKLVKSTKKRDLENSINKLNSSLNELIKGLSSKRFSSLPQSSQSYQVTQRGNKNEQNEQNEQRESRFSFTSRKNINKKRGT